MVIQRWQTIFLLIAATMMGIFTLSSLGQYQLTDYTLNFSTWGISSEGVPTDGSEPFRLPLAYLGVISALGCILPAIDIFLFKNLKLQKQVCAVSTLVIIAAGCTAAIVGYTAIEGASVSWSSAAFAPFIALVGCIAAYRGIAADKKKIESADRIR